ncbi:MAG TPA: hypothetical protein DIC42_03275 [Holosporales bacterium]|nr:hypothetical protein [Holosporales bacterium]
MCKLYLIFLLLFSHAMQAAFIFGDGDPLKPIEKTHRDIYFIRAGELHVLPLAEAQRSFQAQLLDKDCNSSNYHNAKMTAIPQTTWDLFVLLQKWKQEYPIDGLHSLEFPMAIAMTGSYIYLDLNNAFIRMIVDSNLSQNFHARDFTTITKHFLTCIYQHLVQFNNLSKAYAKVGEESPKTSFSQLALLFFFNDLYPEIPALLESATKIEEDLLNKDKLPLWRHAYRVEAAPLVRDEANTIQMRTRGYGYSLLACCLGDGTLAGLGDYQGNCSACAFSYYAQILRDRAFVKKGSHFPYYIPGQVGQMPGTLQKTLEELSDNLTCTILDKRTPNGLFYLPEVYSNALVCLKGDACHPRLKGTLLHRAENNESEFRSQGKNRVQSTQEPREIETHFLALPFVWFTLNAALIEANDSRIAELEAQRLRERKDEDLPNF